MSPKDPLLKLYEKETEGLLKSNEPHHKFWVASTYLTDAKYGRHMKHKTDAISLWWYHFYYHPVFVFLCYFSIIMLFMLCLFEPPVSFKYFDQTYVHALETVLCAILCFESYVKSRFLIPGKWRSDKKNITFVVIMMVMMMDLYLYIAVDEHEVRLSRFLRPFFLVYYDQNVRLALRSILKTIPTISDVMLLIFVVIGLYTMMCMVYFQNTSEGREYFPSFVDGFINLYVLLTTANYPDVMQPGYNEDRYSALIFISYLILCLYLLLNVVLAATYNTYTRGLQREAKRALVHERKCLIRAFAALDYSNRQYLTYDLFVDFYKVFRPEYTERKVRFIWNVLTSYDTLEGALPEDQSLPHAPTPAGYAPPQPSDLSLNSPSPPPPAPLLSKSPSTSFSKIFDCVYEMDEELSIDVSSRRLDLFHFFHLLDISRHSIRHAFHGTPLPFWAVYMGGLYQSRALGRLRGAVNSRYFEWLIDIVVLVNGIIILHNFFKTIHNKSTDLEFSIFCAIYWVEIFLRVFVNGWREYWRNHWSRLDFIVVVLTTASIVAVSMFGMVDNSSAIVLLRLSRLVRFLFKVPRFRLIMETLGSVAPALATYLKVECILFFTFAVIGMELFHGVIRRDNPRLEGTPFAAGAYWGNNFNDLPSAFVTLFELHVVNQWHVIAGGFVACTTKWAWLYFIAFHLLAVILVSNIVIAFVIENYMLQINHADLEPSTILLTIDRIKEDCDQRGHVWPWIIKERKTIHAMVISLFRDAVLAEVSEATATLTSPHVPPSAKALYDCKLEVAPGLTGTLGAYESLKAALHSEWVREQREQQRKSRRRREKSPTPREQHMGYYAMGDTDEGERSKGARAESAGEGPGVGGMDSDSEQGNDFEACNAYTGRRSRPQPLPRSKSGSGTNMMTDFISADSEEEVLRPRAVTGPAQPHPHPGAGDGISPEDPSSLV